MIWTRGLREIDSWFGGSPRSDKLGEAEDIALLARWSFSYLLWNALQMFSHLIVGQFLAIDSWFEGSRLVD